MHATPLYFPIVIDFNPPYTNELMRIPKQKKHAYTYISIYNIYIIRKSKYVHTQICTCMHMCYTGICATMHKYTHMRYTLSRTHANYTQALGSTHERATAFVALGRLAVAVKLVDWIVEYRGQGGGQ